MPFGLLLGPLGERVSGLWIWFGYMSRVSDSGLLGVEGLGVFRGLGCKLQGSNSELIKESR